MRRVFVSPSQYAYLYGVCRLCAWMHLNGAKNPRIESLEAYSLLDKAQRRALPKGTDLRAYGIPGEVAYESAKLFSADLGGGVAEARIVMEYDLVARLEGGALAVVDLKSMGYAPEKVERFRPQVDAYALGLLEPEKTAPMPVESAYLVFCSLVGSVALQSADPPGMVMTWALEAVRVDVDVEAARRRVAEVVALALEPYPPVPSVDCPMCRYLSERKRVNDLSKGERERRHAEVGA